MTRHYGTVPQRPGAHNGTALAGWKDDIDKGQGSFMPCRSSRLLCPHVYTTLFPAIHSVYSSHIFRSCDEILRMRSFSSRSVLTPY